MSGVGTIFELDQGKKSDSGNIWSQILWETGLGHCFMWALKVYLMEGKGRLKHCDEE